MNESLVFMMGKYEARIPSDRLYTTSHFWVKGDADDEPRYRVGFTAYSVRLLQDVYFLDWTIDPNSSVQPKQTIGEVESSKAVSDIYAPAAGVITEFNELVLSDPSHINTAGYEDGWLYRMETESKFLTAAEYIAHLKDHWEEAQRTIKGQMN